MYVKPIPPPGCNPLKDEDRMPIMRLISGDSCQIDFTLWAASGAPASPQNSQVEFVLAENQFSPPLWKGEWAHGVLPDENRPGLAHVTIPRDITKALRRGSYMFSIRVSDMMGWEFQTQGKGFLLVEYAPTSDQHSIPYRDSTSEIFDSDIDDGSSSPAEPETPKYVWLRDVNTGRKFALAVESGRLALEDRNIGDNNG